MTTPQTRLATLMRPDWRDAFAAVGGVRLHYVEAGAGAGRPLVVLLHGFPECWLAWRRQIDPLAAAGLHVIAPDLRGYNLSDRPPRVRDYGVERLVEDVAGLVRHAGHDRATLVGHDWGGIVAWHVAMRRPDVVARLVVLNAPHPAAYRRDLLRTSQPLRSGYVAVFQLPWLPEALVRTRDFAAVRHLFRTDPARPGAYDDAEVDAMVEALARPGALTAALNYYRAAARSREPLRVVRRVEVPTLVVWGGRDRFLVPSLADGLEPWVPHVRVERLPDASHWVHRDAAERVTELVRSMASG